MSFSDFAKPLLGANLTAQLLLILGALWCIAVPQKRIYPMRHKGVFYYVMWTLFYFGFASNAALLVVYWDTGVWTGHLRYLVGGLLALVGSCLTTWAIVTLGTKNTSGLRDGFIEAGPYLFTRNPQYLGDFCLFTGLIVIGNSEVALVTHLLSAFVFVLAPLAEEPWLLEQYGDQYLEYKKRVPRFL